MSADPPQAEDRHGVVLQLTADSSLRINGVDEDSALKVIFFFFCLMFFCCLRCTAARIRDGL